MANQQAEMEHNTKKEAMEAHLAELMKEVRESENPVTIATTEAQNDALAAELQEAYGLWKISKQNETAALLNVEQANATHGAAIEAEQIADDSVVAARAEG